MTHRWSAVVALVEGQIEDYKWELALSDREFEVVRTDLFVSVLAQCTRSRLIHAESLMSSPSFM